MNNRRALPPLPAFQRSYPILPCDCRYVAAVRSSSRWGGHVELQAAATATGIPITVVSASADDRVVNPSPSSARARAPGEGRVAVISFHERQFFAGEHYNSVEPAA